MAQLVERSLPTLEVRGSNPVIGKNLCWMCTVNCIEKTKIKKRCRDRTFEKGKKLEKKSQKHFQNWTFGKVNPKAIFLSLKCSSFLIENFYDFTFNSRPVGQFNQTDIWPTDYLLRPRGKVTASPTWSGESFTHLVKWQLSSSAWMTASPTWSSEELHQIK